MIKRWVTWGGLSRLVNLLLILIVIYFTLTILQSKKPVIPLARDSILKGFSDRNLGKSTSDQSQPSRGVVDGGAGGAAASSGNSRSPKSATNGENFWTNGIKSGTKRTKSGINRTKSGTKTAKSGTNMAKLSGRRSVRLWIDVPTAFPWRQCLQVWRGGAGCLAWSVLYCTVLY